MEELSEDIKNKADLKLIAGAKLAILDCAKNIKSNDEIFHLTTLPNHIADLEKAMQSYIELTKEIEATDKAYLNILEKVEAIEEGDDEEFIEDDDLLNEFDTLTQQEIESMPARQEAMAELNRIIRPREQEARTTETRTVQTLKDPITRQDIKVPVQSSRCKHVFEKETIENYLKNSKKCPQAGCTNKRMTVRELVSFDAQESSPIIIS